jgi:hypothetical protein
LLASDLSVIYFGALDQLPNSRTNHHYTTSYTKPNRTNPQTTNHKQTPPPTMTNSSYSSRKRAHDFDVRTRWTFSSLALIFSLVYCFVVWNFLGADMEAYPDIVNNSTGIPVTTASPIRHISYVHINCGAVWFIISTFQIWPSFRAKHMAAHKFMGKVGVVVAGISAFTSIAMCIAGNVQGGPLMRFGAPIFAILWVHAMVKGIRAIKQGRVAVHEAYMRRAYAVSWAIIGIRLLIVIPIIAGLDPTDALGVTAGFSWVAALVGVEWYNRSQPQELQPTPSGKGLRLLPDTIIPTNKYIKAEIVERRQLPGVNDVAIITLQLSSKDHSYSKLLTPPGCHYNLRAKVDNAIETRPYTPVTGLLRSLAEEGEVACTTDEYSEGNKLSFFVRSYEWGTMSRFLHEAALGTSVELLGPVGSYRLARNQYESMLMLAAGTGITPIMSVARLLIDDQDDTTSMQLVWQNKSDAKVYHKMIEHFIGSGTKKVPTALTSSKEEYAKAVEACSNTAKPGPSMGVIVCGPKPFMFDTLETLKRQGHPRINIHCFGMDDM